MCVEADIHESVCIYSCVNVNMYGDRHVYMYVCLYIHIIHPCVCTYEYVYICM